MLNCRVEFSLVRNHRRKSERERGRRIAKFVKEISLFTEYLLEWRNKRSWDWKYPNPGSCFLKVTESFVDIHRRERTIRRLSAGQTDIITRQHLKQMKWARVTASTDKKNGKFTNTVSYNGEKSARNIATAIDFNSSGGTKGAEIENIRIQGPKIKFSLKSLNASEQQQQQPGSEWFSVSLPLIHSWSASARDRSDVFYRIQVVFNGPSSIAVSCNREKCTLSGGVFNNEPWSTHFPFSYFTLKRGCALRPELRVHKTEHDFTMSYLQIFFLKNNMLSKFTALRHWKKYCKNLSSKCTWIKFDLSHLRFQFDYFRQSQFLIRGKVIQLINVPSISWNVFEMFEKSTLPRGLSTRTALMISCVDLFQFVLPDFSAWTFK